MTVGTLAALTVFAMQVSGGTLFLVLLIQGDTKLCALKLTMSDISQTIS